MIEELDIDYNSEEDEYYILIGGERHGPVDKQSLADFGNDLYMHFNFFQNAPAYEEADSDETKDVSDEDLAEEVETLEEEIEREADKIIEELEDEE